MLAWSNPGCTLFALLVIALAQALLSLVEDAGRVQ